MKDQYPDVIFFKLPNEVAYRLETSELARKGVTFKPIVMYSNGEKEITIMIVKNDANDPTEWTEIVNMVKRIGNAYRLDSYLYSYGDRTTYEVEIKNDLSRYLGVLQEISDYDAQGRKWFLQMDGRIYAAK